MEFSDILYSKGNGASRITINRPNRLNAFTARTMAEICDAMDDSIGDREVGVIVLTGAGDRAFCSGGDVQWEAEGGLVGPTTLRRDMYSYIWACPKPTIARVNGYAIGGGQVLQMVCDLAIASETAKFGQNGPRVGSYNGFAAGWLSHIVGERRAKEIWLLCRQYTAQQAFAMGLVNAVVPPDKLDEEVDKWCQEILALSPGAVRGMKELFRLESAKYLAQASMSAHTVEYLQLSEEAREGQQAFFEKRKPDFSRFR